ncbi:subunit EIIA of glucoside-specific PTS system [Clostridium sporogenes]|uniref:PTS sugar transporter subunit IIA n=1 Tax=Clostridium botulinum TaxID=1491 RepID=UPI00071760BC|nr:PTS glucose transporter subunit IIA [Clostridium botulinum]KRU30181.1 subunit EIIA of glucoside-specific PTS system [Clostridium sporogenes]KRU33586.1 subunit EIIA of glucoside-specific PTS system [Clostridium sporogenes]KRU35895.1 subunit EIIA of glucoside-specific PTS system [Clostridium sporogenes]KRU50543.1 subunit EIIA of glucoside-specific PTS system [Clostridium sporogenes]MBZ1328795.1 PTS glucose transporter subunit IIA [Clostridium botulinum]
MFKKIKSLLSNDKSDVQQENLNEVFVSPISGEIISLDDVPDEVFSQRMMGDGFAIQPENGDVFSPVDGTITAVFPTKHAISIKSKSRVEILIHFGLDTVNLNGEGFQVYVEEGSVVKAGEILLKVNIEEIKNKVPSVVVPIIFMELNGKSFSYNIGKVAAKEQNVITLK